MQQRPLSAPGKAWLLMVAVWVGLQASQCQELSVPRTIRVLDSAISGLVGSSPAADIEIELGLEAHSPVASAPPWFSRQVAAKGDASTFTLATETNGAYLIEASRDFNRWDQLVAMRASSNECSLAFVRSDTGKALFL